jgi:hypothetical protein
MIGLGALVAACGVAPIGSPTGTAATPGAQPLLREQPTLVNDAIAAPAYVHGLNCSRLALGPNTEIKEERGMARKRGDWGVYVIDHSNGHVMGGQRAGSPLLHDTPPYGASVTEHGEAVKAYFSSCGLPASEIAGVLPRVGGLEVARVGEAPHQEGPPMYYSVLTRAIDGVPVKESFAWARIAVSGEVIREDVYWPAIPAAALAEAHELRAQLATAEGRAAFRASLPLAQGAGEGEVAIRHTSAFAAPGTPFEAHATYDVNDRDGHGATTTRHFDVRGRELRLPQERRGEERARSVNSH